MRKHLAAVLSLAMLTGCARYWAKPGGSEEAFDAARARCQSDALARYPAIGRVSMVDQEMIAPKPDLCVAAINGVNCMSNGGRGTPLRLSSQGMSEPARAVFGACMAAAGWQPVANAAEGDAVTRGGAGPRAGG